MMTKLFWLTALAAMMILGGCSRTTSVRSAAPPPPRATAFGPITTAGLKPASQVSPCCADLAAGRIALAECYARPACKAKGNACCLTAVQDLAPARM